MKFLFFSAGVLFVWYLLCMVLAHVLSSSDDDFVETAASLFLAPILILICLTAILEHKLRTLAFYAMILGVEEPSDNPLEYL